jgi:hypothetical protein
MNKLVICVDKGKIDYIYSSEPCQIMVVDYDVHDIDPTYIPEIEDSDIDPDLISIAYELIADGQFPFEEELE